MSLTLESQPASSPRLSAESQRQSVEWDVRCGRPNYLALIGAQAISAVSALAATWLATRLLGAAGYGGIVALIAASQCVSQVTVQWTAVSLSRYGCEEFVETGRLARAFWTRLLILVPNLLIVIAASLWWLPPVAAWLHIPSHAYPLVLTYIVATALWGHVQHALQAAKLPRVQGALLAAERLQIVLMLLALTFIGKPSLSSVMSVYIIAPWLACGLGLWRLRGLVYPGVGIDRFLLKPMLTFSLPLIPYSVIGYLSTNSLDAFFIQRFLSATDLAVYWVAYQVSGMVMQLPLLAGSLLLPFFITLEVNGRENPVARFLREVLPLLTLLWSSGCALLAVVGSYLLPLIFGPPFRATSDLLWPLIAASALAGPMLMGYAPISNAKSATYVSAVCAAVSAGVNVAFNALLIPRFGLVGCAWATAAAYTACAVIGACLVHRRIQISRGWSVPAALPALLGAAFYTWQGNHLGALAVSLSTAAMVALRHRPAVAAGFHLLRTSGLFSSRTQTVAHPPETCLTP